MNRQIGRLSLFFTALIGVLVAFTSWWSVIRADALEENTLNRRPLLEQQQVPRGLVLARDGTRLAVNERFGRGEKTAFRRRYPEGSLYSHAVGYAYISRGSSGLERFYNGVLSGTEGDLRTFLEEIAGGPERGDDIRTTLDPAAQQTARDALAGRKGAIVALDPQDGSVLAMVSQPDYDPNEIPERFRELATDEESSPLVNRATQGQYAPGSTFKVVTAAAALDTGEYSPDSLVDGRNNKLISGAPLSNFGGQEFGTITLTDALTNSVNTVWAEVGEKLGTETMFDYMRRFGFFRDPPLDYPADQLFPSGLYEGGERLDEDDNIDIGRTAIGQANLAVTPLQMAMVAAAIGNGGELMRPHLLDKVIGPDGRTKDNFSPQQQSRVMSEEAASDLAGMMTNVVESGTGTAAQLEGLDVAGKTGTAETGSGDNAWFIAFAPADDPEVAIAVVVEGEQQSQTGGEVAAPLAARVMRVVLDG